MLKISTSGSSCSSFQSLIRIICNCTEYIALYYTVHLSDVDCAISETETLRVRNVVDATRCFFVFFGVHGCEPGRVSDDSRPALCQTLSIECRSLIFLWPVYFVIHVPFSLSFVCVFLCSHWSLVDIPLIFFCPADHVPDWQPRVLLGMVEARSVNVKKTTTTNKLYIPSDPRTKIVWPSL